MSATFPGATQAQIAAQLHQALAMLNAGQLGQAELTLSRVLLARPLEPDALLLLDLKWRTSEGTSWDSSSPP